MSDTWQAMGVTHGKPCVKMHVFTRHMASHVCDTWKAMCQLVWNVNFVYKWNVFVEKGEKKERKWKEAGGFFLSSLAFRRLELVGPRSKVQRFDKGLCFKR